MEGAYYRFNLLNKSFKSLDKFSRRLIFTSFAKFDQVLKSKSSQNINDLVISGRSSTEKLRAAINSCSQIKPLKSM